MKCKFCNEDLPERGDFCPICGMDQRKMLMEDAQMVDGEPESIDLELTEDELIAQALEYNPEETAEEEPAAQEDVPGQITGEIRSAKRLALFTGCIAALAVLALVLFMGIRGGWDVSSWFDWQIFRENTIAYKDSYTVSDKKLNNKKNTVVATLGDAQLTNGQLQIYYWSEVYDFLNENYYYLSYFGMDYTKPLSEQKCYYDKTVTWEQYFLQQALNSWQTNQSLYAAAKANNFQMPAEEQEMLANMASDLEKQAKENKYESADAMVQDSFGACCTVEDYVHYMEVYYYGYMYFASEYEKIDPTMEEIENYFTSNEAALKESGITKDSGNSVDVRHILMLIDNFKIEEEETEQETEQESKASADATEATDPTEATEPTNPTEPADPEDTGDGETDDAESDEEESEFTKEEWAACLAEAQRILELWKLNPTEDYFAELANEHSDDQDGKVTNGGLYEGITSETNFVKPFLDWCMNKDRQIGDCEIVQTEYGYHIMYFSATEPLWVATCRSELIAAEAQKIVKAACDQFTPEINYKKIVLADMEL